MQLHIFVWTIVAIVVGMWIGAFVLVLWEEERRR